MYVAARALLVVVVGVWKAPQERYRAAVVAITILQPQLAIS